GDRPLPLVWQWNHNPDNANWSVTAHPGSLRLTTGRVDTEVTQARNTLTQRTFGLESSATTAINVSSMKDGDYAGMIALQKKYSSPHFMGYRFGLFNFATKTAGGFVDFDYIRLSDKINAAPTKAKTAGS